MRDCFARPIPGRPTISTALKSVSSPNPDLIVHLVAASALVVAFTACSWAHQPRADDDVDLQWDVEDPTRSSPQAHLFLTDDGLWGYEPADDRDFEPRFEPGRLLELSTDDHDYTFAVVEADDWGYRFQRLDDHPTGRELGGVLRALRPDDLADDDSYCLVSSDGDVAEQCGLSHHHRRWHLYALGDESESETGLSVAGQFEDFATELSFPVQRDGLTGGDRLDHWLEGVSNLDEAGPLVGVAARPGPETTIRPSVVYGNGCDATAGDTDLVGARHDALEDLEVQLDADTHPVAVEAAAWETGADTIVDCRGEGPRMYVPMLTRPMLTGGDHRYLGPSSLGLTPRDLGDEPSERADGAWPRAAALVTAGDAPAASFWIERALGETGDDDERLRLALASMPVVATGNRPELALRVGNRITDGFWHPENDPDYLDGLIAVLDVVGHSEQLRDRLEHRDRLVDRHHEHRAGWFRWAGVRHQIAGRRGSHGPAFRETIDTLHDRQLDGWAVAVWLTLQLEGLELPIVDDPADLKPRFAEFDADRMWTSLLEETADPACRPGADEYCAPTAYGWRTVEEPPSSALPRALRNVGSPGLTDGYGLTEATETARRVETPAETLRYWLAVSALMPDRTLESVNRAATEALAENFERDADRLCTELADWKTRFADAAARPAAPVLDDRRREWIELLNWWGDRGLDGLCESPDQLLAAIEDHRDPSTPWFGPVLEVLELRVMNAPATEESLAVLERAVDVADAVGADEVCARWSLGLALGATRTGRFETARETLAETTGCISSDSPLVEARKLISAYLDFERSGGRPLITDGGVDQTVRAATRQRLEDPAACAGLAPLGFQIDNHLPASVTRIAGRIAAGPAPHHDFGLETASSVVDDGAAAYLAGIRDLQRGAVDPGARALLEAARHFDHVDHLPGLGRIALIDEVVFDGRLPEWPDDEDNEDDAGEPTDRAAPLHRGEAHRITDNAPHDLSTLADEQLAVTAAAMLIDQRDDRLTHHLEDTSRLPSLCRPDTSRYSETTDGDDPPVIDEIGAADM